MKPKKIHILIIFQKGKFYNIINSMHKFTIPLNLIKIFRCKSFKEILMIFISF